MTKKKQEIDQTLSDDKMLDLSIKTINKKMGERGKFFCLGDVEQQDFPSISTGSLKLNKIIGTGGLPRGRITEIFGPPSAGKTSIALQTCAQGQKENNNTGIVAFIDMEHSVTPERAESLGVDLKRIYVMQPSCGEDALEAVKMCAQSNIYECIVMDSVDALVTTPEIEGDISKQHIGQRARLMSQGMRQINPIIINSKSAVIFINQIRHKVGIVYGPTETTSGGEALKFYASLRLKVMAPTSAGKIMNRNNDEIGFVSRVRVVKNKLAAPFKSCEFPFLFESGVDNNREIVELALDAGVLSIKGSWYYFGEETLGQGAESVLAQLAEDPELFNKIRKEIGT